MPALHSFPLSPSALTSINLSGFPHLYFGAKVSYTFSVQYLSGVRMSGAEVAAFLIAGAMVLSIVFKGWS